MTIAIHLSIATGSRARALVAGVFAATLVAAGVGSSTVALAQASCQADFARLQDRRTAQIASLNAQAKKNKGKLDPQSACPRLRALAGIEGEMLAYMKKNKDWCNIPDQIVEQVATGRGKTASLASKACAAAAQIAKMKREQAAGGAAAAAGLDAQRPKLPTGPL